MRGNVGQVRLHLQLHLTVTVGREGLQHNGDTGLLPTGSEERGVLGVRSIPVAILPSCQNVKTMSL